MKLHEAVTVLRDLANDDDTTTPYQQEALKFAAAMCAGMGQCVKCGLVVCSALTHSDAPIYSPDVQIQEVRDLDDKSGR
jgi:hypothetical protein